MAEELSCHECVIRALYCLEPGRVLGRSSPRTSDSAGPCEKEVWEPRGRLSSLNPWHSAEFPVYLSAAGQNALSESCSYFGKGKPGHLHMALIKSSSTYKSFRHLFLPCLAVLGSEDLKLCQ